MDNVRKCCGEKMQSQKKVMDADVLELTETYNGLSWVDMFKGVKWLDLTLSDIKKLDNYIKGR